MPEFARAIQRRQELQVACLEEIAYLWGFIDREQLVALGKLSAKTAHGRNLLRIADEPDARDEAPLIF